MEFSLFAFSVLISLLLFGLAVVGFSRGWFVAKTTTEQEIDELRRQIDWLTAERNQLMAEIVQLRRDSTEEIKKLRAEKDALEREIAQLRQQIRKNTDTTVLGIWPQSELDVHGERDAVRRSGLKYRALFGNQVTPGRIIRELRQGDIGIIEIGAHGDVDRLIIGDLNLDAGWWLRVIEAYGRHIQVAVILACFSDQSVADAIKRAGVRHVIAATSEIEDAAAVDFVEQFYSLFADGYSAKQAFEEAKLAIDYRQAEMLVLR